MAWNDEIESGAKAIAEDFKLPGGRRKRLAKVVARHLSWFDVAEARDMTWGDMIAVLAAAGARRKNGLPFTRGTLSSTVWRKREEAAANAGRQGGLSDKDRLSESDEMPKRASEARAAGRVRSRPTKGTTGRDATTAGAAKPTQMAKRGSRSALREDGDETSGDLKTRSRRRDQTQAPTGSLPRPPAGGKKSSPSGENVLAYMRQTMRKRQRHDNG
jgi:hypothetical protein